MLSGSVTTTTITTAKLLMPVDMFNVQPAVQRPSANLSSSAFTSTASTPSAFHPPPLSISTQDEVGADGAFRPPIYFQQSSAPSSPYGDVPANPLSPGICSICHDKATGKHYGASSCDGCKGFFRRTVRKKQRYTCRFQHSCLIDKDRRNACRYCRYKKCLDAGMRKEAVQNERDRINSRKVRKSESSSLGDHINCMLRAEQVCSQLRSSVITSGSDAQSQKTQLDLKGYHQGDINDISDAMRQQLLLLVEWAKIIPEFFELALDDQVSLLRAYAAEHLLLGVARRSISFTDTLLLSNNTYVLRKQTTELPDMSHVINRVLDELVEPLRHLDVDETEYVCLKGIVFFNPYIHGIADRVKIKQKRQAVLGALETYVSSKPLQTPTRFGNLLLLLPSLQGIGQQMKESLQLASLFGLAKMDNLLTELLLSSASESPTEEIQTFDENFEDQSNADPTTFHSTTEDANIDTPDPEITSLSDVNEPVYMAYMKRESLNDGGY